MCAGFTLPFPDPVVTFFALTRLIPGVPLLRRETGAMVMSNDALVGRTAALEVIAKTQFAFNNPPGGVAIC